MAKALAALFLAAPLLAGGLQGPVKVVDKDGRARDTLKDTIAILEPLGRRTQTPKRPALRIRTTGKRFLPRVAWTTPGSPVSFPNQDHILHNVFSVTPGDAFDTGHYEPGDAPPWTAGKPGLVKLYCNVHRKMNAFLWVVDTPWAEVLDGKQGVAFRDLPPGRYTLRLWHPEAGEKDFEVSVDEGTTAGAWTLQASLPDFEPHKNKFGRDYPPAKDEGNY
jgi:plastocyanin